MTALDIILFSGSIYGLAWITTKSKLFAPIRNKFADTPFLGELLQCIVCTSVWVSFLVILLLPFQTLFSVGFRSPNLLDALILVGWTAFFSWAVGSKLGDAD